LNSRDPNAKSYTNTFDMILDTANACIIVILHNHCPLFVMSVIYHLVQSPYADVDKFKKRACSYPRRSIEMNSLYCTNLRSSAKAQFTYSCLVMADGLKKISRRGHSGYLQGKPYCGSVH
jgi:hypothetical protein